MKTLHDSTMNPLVMQKTMIPPNKIKENLFLSPTNLKSGELCSAARSLFVRVCVGVRVHVCACVTVLQFLEVRRHLQL